MSRYMAAVHLEEISWPIFDAFFDSGFFERSNWLPATRIIALAFCGYF